jgi:hypothetical protein
MNKAETEAKLVHYTEQVKANQLLQDLHPTLQGEVAFLCLLAYSDGRLDANKE